MLNPAIPVLPSLQARPTMWVRVPPVPDSEAVGVFKALLTKLSFADAISDTRLKHVTGRNALH
jgi:hypothetical protein